jgi:hypothetical protein
MLKKKKKKNEFESIFNFHRLNLSIKSVESNKWHLPQGLAVIFSHHQVCVKTASPCGIYLFIITW